jgi:hypothetical protein
VKIYILVYNLYNIKDTFHVSMHIYMYMINLPWIEKKDVYICVCVHIYVPIYNLNIYRNYMKGIKCFHNAFIYHVLFYFTHTVFSFSFFYFIIFTFTYMCIYCLGHLPIPPATFPLPSVPGRTCSVLLFSDFVEEKT